MNRLVIHCFDRLERLVRRGRVPLASRVTLRSLAVNQSESLAMPIGCQQFSELGYQASYRIPVRVGGLIELQFENRHWLPVVVTGLILYRPHGISVCEENEVHSWIGTIEPRKLRTFELRATRSGLITRLIVPTYQP
jgi:hypothetical protein